MKNKNLTYEQAIKSGQPFNRQKYGDGFYIINSKGLVTHHNDLSVRSPRFSEEDKGATDWYIMEPPNDEMDYLKQAVQEAWKKTTDFYDTADNANSDWDAIFTQFLYYEMNK